MEKMKENISAEVLQKVNILLKEMLPETNLVEIPDSDGMKIIRVNSKEFGEKEGDPTIMFFEIPDNDEFWIITK
ncbi:MAG: hypothetical protein C0412_15130 [Flavobacterium sp.]|nr:hypothetical protein [Flavobacterium sp.]